MKILVKPLIVSALILVPVGVFAGGYSDVKVMKTINQMDDNANKKVDFQEYFEATVTDNEDPLDTNQDGYITSGEIVLEIKEDLIETIKQMRKAGVSETNINKTIAKELNTAEKEAEALIKKMDADGDSLVEPDEFIAYKKKQFAALDKNRDGTISSSDASGSKKSSGPGYTVVPYKASN